MRAARPALAMFAVGIMAAGATSQGCGSSDDAAGPTTGDGGPTDATVGPVDGGNAAPVDGGPGPGHDADTGAASSTHVITYEAEGGQLTGGAVVTGAADGSTRTVGDPAGEASGRQAVLLPAAGASVGWTVQAQDVGARALVVRFSLPDAAGGGGTTGALGVTVHDAQGTTRATATLSLTSRYAWLYGGTKDGTKLYNVPANAQTYATATTPIHVYDETQLLLPVTLAAGDVVSLTRPGGSSGTLAIDFAELEVVPEAAAAPAGFLAVTDPSCAGGAIAFDVRATASVFDGADDSSYGSVFHAVLGHNPINPVTFMVAEKDYYSTDPSADALQDTTTNTATGMSMFDLADHNTASFQACVDKVKASSGALSGVWIPPGRYYARGTLRLADGVSLEGAGRWYSKIAAVDTAPPVAVSTTDAGADAGAIPELESTSGNLIITGGDPHGAVATVTVSGFSLFGNLTQRDVVDSVVPNAMVGAFTGSTIADVWVEHYFSGLKMNGAATADSFSRSRVRDVFADGIDFYGSTSSSTIDDCQVRGAGDDGFALWAQGDDGDAGAVSHDNAIINCTSQLSWWGNGFALYGGVGDSIADSGAADLLNYPGLQISTNFVPATIAADASMSASASSVTLVRTGGDGFASGFGGLVIGTGVENLDGITVDHVLIESPANGGVDLRPLPAPADHQVGATLANVTLHDVAVIGVPTCARVQPYVGGSAALDDVCACADAGASPAMCDVLSDSGATFSFSANTCTATSCE